MPKVVHCKRERYDVYIGRPGPLGNPFIIGRHGDRATVVRLHSEWFLRQPELVAKVKRELRGMTLGCWCAPDACHGDIYLKVANE